MLYTRYVYLGDPKKFLWERIEIISLSFGFMYSVKWRFYWKTTVQLIKIDKIKKIYFYLIFAIRDLVFCRPAALVSGLQGSKGVDGIEGKAV